MGFKCPNCKKDFGFDKKALEKHLNEESGECGAIAYLYKLQVDVLTGKKIKKKHIENKKVSKPRRKHSFVDSNHHFQKTNLVSNEDGSDNVECIHCGLKAKRVFNSYRFDGRISYKKIEKCIKKK